jgi:ABC-2 type transport system ATP-binding protein
MITLDNVTKYYEVYKSAPGLKGSIKNFFNRKIEKKLALDNISFTIEKGNIIGLLGPNGAGKTTILKILSGLILPSNGYVNVAGFNPFERKKEFKKKISFVMGQKSQLWWDLPAIQSFILNKHIYEIDNRLFNERLNYLVEIFNIKDYLNIQVRKLSFGQRMKLEIIGSLLHNPEVIFLDEPTIGLDFDAQNVIRNFILEYNKRYKATFIITSHNLNDIEIVCNDIIVLNKGQKIVNDSIKNVINKFSNEKIVNITFESPVISNDNYIQFGEIEKIENNTIKIKVKKADIMNLISFCYNNTGIVDMNIKEVPFELVIKGILNNGEIYEGSI